MIECTCVQRFYRDGWHSKGCEQRIANERMSRQNMTNATTQHLWHAIRMIQEAQFNFTHHQPRDIPTLLTGAEQILKTILQEETKDGTTGAGRAAGQD